MSALAASSSAYRGTFQRTSRSLPSPGSGQRRILTGLIGVLLISSLAVPALARPAPANGAKAKAGADEATQPKSATRHIVVPPLFFHRKDQRRTIDVLFPVVWHWRDHVQHSTSWIIGPYLSRSDDQGTSRTLFPLVWHFANHRTGASTTLLLPPLAYHQRRADGSQLSMLFPFYYGSSQHGWNAGLLPLFYLGASPGRRHLALLPVFWYSANPQASTTVVGPWYLRRSHAPNAHSWATGLAPLFFAGRSASSSHLVVFPLLWHFRSDRNATRTVVAGPFFYRRSAQEHSYGILPPLFYRSASEDGRTRSLLFGPYYQHNEPRSRVQVLFPLFWSGRTWNAHGVTQSSSTTLLPFFWHRRTTDGELLVTPVGGRKIDTDRGLDRGLWGLYAWHRTRHRRSWTVFPFVFRDHDLHRHAKTTVVLFPLTVRYTSPTASALVFFPIFWKSSDAEQRSLVVFPFYWSRRDHNGSSTDVVFPVLWRFGNRERKLTIAGPVFWENGRHTKAWGVAPLAVYHRNEKRSLALALPFFYYRHRFAENERTWVAGPIYWRTAPRSYAVGLLPIFLHKRSPERNYTIVPPLVWHFAAPAAKRSTTVVGPVVYRSTPQRRALGVAPLFYSSVERQGGRTVALMPLFYWRGAAQRHALFTPLFGFDRRQRGTSWYVPPYLHWRSAKSTLDLLAPLGFRRFQRERKETTVFALPGYYGRWSRGRSVHFLFPFFLRRNRIDRVDTVLAPIFWDFNDRFRSRTTALVPFFFRRRDEATKETSWLFPPGVWISTRPKSADTVVFPVFWHYGGQRRSSTVGFPLYWDFKRNERRSTVVFPLFWRFDRHDHRTYLVFNTYYRRNKRDGTYNLVVFPFVQVKRPARHELSWEVLGGLVGYNRTATKRTLRIFFIPFELDPPQPRQAPSAHSGAKSGG